MTEKGEIRGTTTSRSMSYAGCWTCRKRRVKCDERPDVCRVCEGAKLVCAGYDVRLIWDVGRLRKPQASRRQIKPDRHTYHPMTEDEVMQTIIKVDKFAAESATATFGPFSVFELKPSYDSDSDSTVSDPHSGYIDTGEPLSFQEVQSNCGSVGSPHRNKNPEFAVASQFIIAEDGLEPLNKPSSTGFDVLSNSQDRLTNLASNQTSTSEQPPADISTQPISPEESGKNFNDDGRGFLGSRSLISFKVQKTVMALPGVDNTDSQTCNLPDRFSEWSNEHLKNTSSFLRNRAPFEHFDGLSIALTRNRKATMLIHHYTQHMVHLMQPVSHPGNPFKTIYLPLAIEGSLGMKVSGDSEGSFSASVTVFHSLLSTAAIHLQSLQSGEDGLQQLAFHHKQRALIALRSTLEAQSSNYKDLMIAILSLVSADIIGGGTSNHWIHLEAAIRLQGSHHNANLINGDTRQLNSICRMLHLFAQTALPQLNPKPWSGLSHVSDGVESDGLEPDIEFIYGITKSLAGVIFKIHYLTKYIAYYKDQQYPRTLVDACETLGQELHAWSIYSEPFSAIDPKQGRVLRIARAQAKAFHNAALIYYYRSVQNCARQRLHLEQQAVLAAMNQAEDLKVSFGKPAPITWPAFIASCEAVGEDRQLWDQWWTRVQEYRMGNYSTQHSIVRGLWAELGNDDSSIDWRDALAAKGLRIIPV